MRGDDTECIFVAPQEKYFISVVSNNASVSVSTECDCPFRVPGEVSLVRNVNPANKRF